MEGKESFEWENIVFEELEDGKIKCGICQTETVRLVIHMNSRQGCGQGFNMLEFKVKYTKHRAKIRGRKREEKQKAENIQSFTESKKKRQKKHEGKKKAEDLDAYRESYKSRRKKSEHKKKAEDLDVYRESYKRRIKKSEQKKKAEDLDAYRESYKSRIKKSEQKNKFRCLQRKLQK